MWYAPCVVYWATGVQQGAAKPEYTHPQQMSANDAVMADASDISDAAAFSCHRYALAVKKAASTLVCSYTRAEQGCTPCCSLHEDEKASPAVDLPSGTRLPNTGLEHIPRAGAADGQPPHTAVQRLIATESASPSAVHAQAAGSHAELESTAGLDSNGQKPGKVWCMACCIGSSHPGSRVPGVKLS